MRIKALIQATLVMFFVTALGIAEESRPTPSPGWSLISVPGITNLAGTAWYRGWVKVPDSFFASHERNLFEESVGIHIRDLSGAHELFVNGTKIGMAGSFPPQYRSAGDQIHRHKVPMGTLRKGEWNEISLRVYNPSGDGGFLTVAPFIMDYFSECVLEGLWEFKLGEDYTPGKALVKRPGAAVFDSFRESNRVLGRSEQVHGPKLPAEESASKLQPAEGFDVDLLLSEPLVAQPTHFSFDERGRLWIAQYRQYPYPAGLTMVSRDKYYRAHYDKVPPPPPNHDSGADIISIHEDSNGDGVFDKHKVFLDGLNLANAVVRGRGGVWVMHTPYLLFYPDKNGDDVPDGSPEVHLAGFGLEDTHSVANGLVWGMDGWLYGAQGSTTSCRVTRPGIDREDAPVVYFEGCMVWRYHPDTRAFEIFAEGSGNTFGLEVDAQGRLHSGHNGGQTRGWHYVQGGFYRMQGVDPGKFGPPRNPYAFGELPMMHTTNSVVRFTHFGAFADGTAVPDSAKGRLFSLDPLHNVVVMSDRQSLGSTFETVDRGAALQSKDETFRPLFIANAPDGSLFISDMCEFYIAHGQHYQNQIDPTSGRMYRLRGKESTLEADTNLEKKSSLELVGLLSHSNKWHRHTAVRLLGERKDRKASRLLKQVVAKDKGLGALNALWALHQSGGLDEDTMLVGLRHSYAQVRMWTARLLGDDYGLQRNLGVGQHARSAGKSSTGAIPGKMFRGLLSCAAHESDPEVLSQLASTARRLECKQALALASAVLKHDEMAGDPFIPLLCWWVFEAHIPAGNSEIVEFFGSSNLWDTRIASQEILPRLVRRYAVEGKRSDLLLCAKLFDAAPSAKHAKPLMKGFEEAFRGRAMVSFPEELVAALRRAGEAPLVIRLKQKEPSAVDEALKLIEESKAGVEERAALARVLGEMCVEAAIPAMLRIVSSRPPQMLGRAVLVALSSFEDENIGSKVADLLPDLSGDVRTAALSLLASRATWSLKLLDTLESGRLQASSIPEDVLNRLRASKDATVRERANRIFPELQQSAVALAQRIDQIDRILKKGPGNPYAGEEAFTVRCGSCHKLFFKGGNVGPDLTSYQRDDLGTMLLSIINPNAEIREGYQYYSIETKDGRTLSGFFIERDNQITVLRGLEGENITLRSSDISELKPIGRSLMPEGLLEGMTEQELRDFFAYLRISQPITK